MLCQILHGFSDYFNVSEARPRLATNFYLLSDSSNMQTVRMAQDEMDVNLRSWVWRDAGPTESELNISADEKGELLLSFSTTNYGNSTPTLIKYFLW